MLQKMWSLNLPWDRSVPEELGNSWISFRSQLPELNRLHISRQATCHNLKNIEIHGFSDASQNAYGACIYLRTEDTSGRVHVHLLASKTRVAPLKTLSIPRLELCAALLLSQLYSKITSALSKEVSSVYLWCDSTIALSWIRSSPHLFQTFVGNRVSEIQRHAPSELWNYVPSGQNPADFLSRGLSPKSFIEVSEMWFYGPEWLKKSSANWPVDPIGQASFSIEELPEVWKNLNVFVQSENLTTFPFTKFSSFGRIIRVMAYCLRFIENCE